MYGLFAGLTTLDVAQLTADEVEENKKVTALDQVLAAGGPATNAAVVFSALNRSKVRLAARRKVSADRNGAHAGRSAATVLLTAVGDGPAAQLIATDVEATDIALVDCTDYDAQPPANADEIDYTPTVSTIFVNAKTGARTLASTNSRLPLRPDMATASLEAMGNPQVVLVDGHNPELGLAALTYGTDPQADDPFAAVDYEPPYLRILDGGSWKPWLTSMLGFVDVAVLSGDFVAPGASSIAETVEFLRGFGITRVIQTNGAEATRWWWGETSGELAPPGVDVVCTLAAGDVFHGAFAWGCVTGSLTRESDDPTAVIDFANHIAALSTTVFGTRAWLHDYETIEREVERLLDAEETRL
ncbi:MAG: PfkB family carbohydrate kinase [Actinomycetaceae bacterium]|nr:PfkB family carbohydrate kinase [Actinomycetaceae bacterium]